MTSPDLPASRPVPDTDDLRLLHEIVNNGAIGLPQAAWNARMSQSEAAARLVQMAERNMPLRLVVEGDRQLLWRITQAGPATSGVPVGGAPVGGAPVGGQGGPGGPAGPGGPGGPAAGAGQAPPRPAGPPPSQSGAVPVPVPGQGPDGPGFGQQPPGPPPVQPGPGPLPGGQPPPMPAGPQPAGPGPVAMTPASGPAPIVLPPTPAVPPHEQAIAGAVPLGQPPFGTPAPEASAPVEPQVVPDAQAPEITEVPAVAEIPAVPDAESESAAPSGPEVAAVQESPTATWGVPGTAGWARADEPDSGRPDDAPPGAAPVSESVPEPTAGTSFTKSVAGGPEQVDVPSAEPTGQEPWIAAQLAADAAGQEPPAAESGGVPVAVVAGVAAGQVGEPGGPWGPGQVAADAPAQAPHDADGGPPVPPAEDWTAGQVAADAVPAQEPEPEPEPDPEPEPEPVPAAEPEPEPEPAPQVFAVSPPQVQWQTTVGLAGEQLWFTLLEVIDPADHVLTNAGYRLEPGERAILVRTAMANHGPAPHDALPDHYLVLRTVSGQILQKAPMGLGSHPAYRVGVAPGGQTDGWTVFLVPADTVVSSVIWSVRPDLVDRTLSWRV